MPPKHTVLPKRGGKGKNKVGSSPLTPGASFSACTLPACLLWQLRTAWAPVPRPRTSRRPTNRPAWSSGVSLFDCSEIQCQHLRRTGYHIWSTSLCYWIRLLRVTKLIFCFLVNPIICCDSKQIALNYASPKCCFALELEGARNKLFEVPECLHRCSSCISEGEPPSKVSEVQYPWVRCTKTGRPRHLCESGYGALRNFSVLKRDKI